MDQAVEGLCPSTEIHPLLRYALATASVYGVCGCGPSGPALTFAGANLANGVAVIGIVLG